MHFSSHVGQSKTESNKSKEGQKIKNKRLYADADLITRQLTGKKFCNFYLAVPKNRCIIVHGRAVYMI